MHSEQARVSSNDYSFIKSGGKTSVTHSHLE